MCRSGEGAVRWLFRWRRELFEWEKDIVKDLLARLDGRVMGVKPDVWVWKPGEDGMFSLKSCYTLLHSLSYGVANLNDMEKVIFLEIWRCKAPTKVLAFSWTLLLDRIPSKINLANRSLLRADESKRCVFCDEREESAIHLFLHCSWVSKVWREVMRWLNFNIITPPNLFLHALGWSREVSSKKLRRGAWVIWHAVVWVIWTSRNNMIFKAKTFEILELVDHIKLLSWQWCLSRLNIKTFLFYEWCWNPRFCLRGWLVVVVVCWCCFGEFWSLWSCLAVWGLAAASRCLGAFGRTAFVLFGGFFFLWCSLLVICCCSFALEQPLGFFFMEFLLGVWPLW